MMQNSEASKWLSYWNSMFLSVDHWIFYSVSYPHLIQIQKIILVIFWNSINLWAIWWEYVYYGHHLIEFHCKSCNLCEIFGFKYVLAYWQTRIDSCNWAEQFRFSDGGIVWQKLPFLSVSLSPLSMFVVHKLGLSLITLMNCFSKFFKMAILRWKVNWNLKYLMRKKIDKQKCFSVITKNSNW